MEVQAHRDRGRAHAKQVALWKCNGKHEENKGLCQTRIAAPRTITPHTARPHTRAAALSRQRASFSLARHADVSANKQMISAIRALCLISYIPSAVHLALSLSMHSSLFVGRRSRCTMHASRSLRGRDKDERAILHRSVATTKTEHFNNKIRMTTDLLITNDLKQYLCC